MEPFPVTRIAHIEASRDSQRWLVESLWADQAVGFIASTPKAGKTWLALELAVAVASGRPCLGRYPVHQRGHVLLYAAEDTADAIRHRVCAIARARNINDISHLAVGLITTDNLRLDNDDHQQRLALTLDKLRPRMLVLDPLIRLHHSDENSAADVSFLLHYLRQLQREYSCAIILVHHVRKSAASQPGQALRGSGDLHAWADSNLYLLRRKGHMLLQAEHRALPSPSPVAIELCTKPEPHLCVIAEDEEPDKPRPDPLIDRILASLLQHPMTRTDLRAALSVRNERLGEALAALEAAGRVHRQSGLLAVPVPNPKVQPGPERSSDGHSHGITTPSARRPLRVVPKPQQT